jgi:hypothetical protein
MYGLLSIAALLLAIGGSWGIEHVWATLPKAETIAHSVVVGGGLGIIFIFVFILSTLLIGPAPLSRAIKKFYSRKKV